MQLAGELELQRDVMRVYSNPTTLGKEPEKVGEIRAKSRKLEVKIVFE